MSESQRRLLLRFLFVAVCIVPTSIVLAVGLTRRGESDRRAWRQALSLHVGMRVTVEGVGYPWPGVTVLERVRCYDAESDALVVDCRRLEIEHRADGLALRAAGAEIFADRGERLFATLERRLRRELPDAERPVEFEAPELTWHAPGTSQSLVDVAATVGPAESAQQLVVNFSLPGAPVEQPAALRIKRSTASTPVETVVELDTGAVVLPCSLFSPLTDVVDSLGPAATFLGRMRLRRGGDDWNGTIAGDLADVDLDRAVAAYVPRQLSGSAAVQIHRAELTGGRVERLHATVQCSGGVIGRSLLIAACEHLGLGDGTVSRTADSVIPFDGLLCDVALSSDGVAIASPSADSRRPLLWRGNDVYWRQPALAVQPTANLLRALAPDRQLLVPAQREVAGLINRLPLPSGRAEVAPTFEGGPLEANLRLRGPVNDEPQRR